MSTLILNITGGSASLPAPYRGILGPGKGALVSDAMATVVTNLGGVDNISSIFRLEISAAPGNPANDPAPGAGVPVYTNSAARPALPSAALPAGTEIFVGSDGADGVGAPQFVSADGLSYVDAAGNLT